MAQAQKDAQLVLTEGAPMTQTKTAREEDDDGSGSEDEEELVDSAQKDQA